jgi:hypothetical protein
VTIEIATGTGRTVKDEMPGEWIASEYGRTPAWKHRDVVVVRKYLSHHKRWPGSHRNVRVWLVLDNGKAIGWNEGAQGWTFPVIRYEACTPK